MKSNKLTRTFISLIMVAPICAFAQTAEDAGALLENQKNLEEIPALPYSVPDTKLVDRATPKSHSTSQTVVVSSFTLQGVTAFKDERILSLIESYKGQSLSFNELLGVCKMITNFYKQHGYFLARAYLPQQGYEDGKVIIRVQEGTLDKGSDVQLRGKQMRLSPLVPLNMLDNEIKAGAPIRMGELERVMLNINDIPGVRGTAHLTAGDNVGGTKVLIDMTEGPVFKGRLGTDNAGSRLTSPQRITGELKANDPFGVGDQFKGAFNTGFLRNNNYFNFAYDAPLGFSGLRGGFAYSHLNYAVGKELAALNLTGKAAQYSFMGRYPWVRTRLHSVFINAGLDYKNLYDRAGLVVLNNKRVSVGHFGVSMESLDKFGGGGFNALSASITSGHLNLSKVPSAVVTDQAANGPRAGGVYTKLNYSLARLQKINTKLSFMGSLNGQFAAKNLDSSEKIQFGGPFGVRAYPVGEANADEGHKLTMELRTHVASGTRLGDAQVFGFYDNAWVRLAHEPRSGFVTTPENSYSIAGAGFGVALNKQSVFDVRGLWAAKLKRNPARSVTNEEDNDGSKSTNRFWVTANIYF